jgi:glycerol-3-phosphate dehydrogenase
MRRSLTRTAPYFPEATPTRSPDHDDPLWQQLQTSYAPRAAEVYDLCTSEPGLARRAVESSPVMLGQLAYALREEKALTLADLVLRRTRLSWQPDLDTSTAKRLVAALAPYFPDRGKAALAEAERIDELLARDRLRDPAT